MPRLPRNAPLRDEASADEDWALSQRVAGGDRAAFQLLVLRHEGRLRAFLSRAAGCDADDLAQETFVRAWQHRGQFTTGRAVNLARNRLRWWKRRPVVALEEWTDVSDGPASGEDEGSRHLESAERSAAVRDALASLPPDFREALVLFEYEHMSYAEIAATVGASVKTVENRIARARERLRTKLRALA